MSSREGTESSLSKLLRALRVGLFFAISPLYMMAIILAVLITKDVRYWHPLVKAWAVHALWLFRIEVEAIDQANIEPGRDYVLLCNHRSHFDIFALFATLPHTYTRWVAKRELADIPLFGYALKVSGQILVDRRDHTQAIRELSRHLGDRGFSIIFFAEGQRSDDAILKPFKKGAAAFAIDAGLPVVPVAISGSQHVLVKHSLMVAPGKITVRVGEPIETTGLKSDDRTELTEQAHAQVARMLDSMEPRAHEASASHSAGYSRGANVHV
jgi:1-acyl-sn-glycerol-3-phosphate acyltransferase